MYLKDEDGEEGEDEESEGSQEGSHRHLLYDAVSDLMHN